MTLRDQSEGLSLPFRAWTYLLSVNAVTRIHAFIISEIGTVHITRTVWELNLGQNATSHSLQKRFRDGLNMWMEVRVGSPDKKETKNKVCLI